MNYFTDSIKALVTSVRNVFRPVVTQEFPKFIRPRPERYRTSFALIHDETGDEACIGCLQCERICPSQVISIKPAGKRESKITGKKRGYADDFTLDLNACIYCELCVQVCPTDAIVMTKLPEEPTYTREDLVLTMARLYANEKAKPLSWSNGTKLMDMQDSKPKPAPGAAAPAAAAPAPVAAAPAATTAAPAAASAAAVPAAAAPAVAAAAATPAAPAAAPATPAADPTKPSGGAS